MNGPQRARARQRVRAYADRILLSIDPLERAVKGNVTLEMIATNLKGLANAINELADVSEAQETNVCD